MPNNHQSSQLKTQLLNTKEIKSVLREVNVSFELADGTDVDTLLVHFPYADGDYDAEKFFECVRNEILHNFSLSCGEIEKKLGVSNNICIEDLFQKAVRKLSKHTAQGELGELILFTLLDVYLKAPKLLSKISLKTSRKMPVYGADAVHGQFHDNSFRLYLGESKLHKNFKSAATKAAKSIKTSASKFSEEFDLLDSHMNFSGINDDIERQLLDFLNPYSENDCDDFLYFPCFIGFSEPELISGVKSEAELAQKYIDLALDYIQNFFEKVIANKMPVEKIYLFMLPYSCVDLLTDDFIKYIGLEE